MATYIKSLCMVVMIFTNYSTSFAQERWRAEEQFGELFITAGYTTAFGAALGAAMIGLTLNPTKNMRYIATGASIGFIAGSLLGSYIVFSPSIQFMAAKPDSSHSKAIKYGQINKIDNINSPRAKTIDYVRRNNKKHSRFYISPTWNPIEGKIKKIEAQVLLASF